MPHSSCHGDDAGNMVVIMMMMIDGWQVFYIRYSSFKCVLVSHSSCDLL